MHLSKAKVISYHFLCLLVLLLHHLRLFILMYRALSKLSVSGHEFYVSFVDAYSRFTWIYLLKLKSDVFQIFLWLQKHVERLLNKKSYMFK
jgi:hypothetical protein